MGFEDDSLVHADRFEAKPYVTAQAGNADFQEAIKARNTADAVEIVINNSEIPEHQHPSRLTLLQLFIRGNPFCKLASLTQASQNLIKKFSHSC